MKKFKIPRKDLSTARSSRFFDIQKIAKDQKTLDNWINKYTIGQFFKSHVNGDVCYLNIMGLEVVGMLVTIKLEKTYGVTL